MPELKTYEDVQNYLQSIIEYLPRGYVAEIQLRLRLKSRSYGRTVIQNTRHGVSKNIVILEEIVKYAEENKKMKEKRAEVFNRIYA